MISTLITYSVGNYGYTTPSDVIFRQIVRCAKKKNNPLSGYHSLGNCHHTNLTFAAKFFRNFLLSFFYLLNSIFQRNGFCANWTHPLKYPILNKVDYTLFIAAFLNNADSFIIRTRTSYYMAYILQLREIDNRTITDKDIDDLFEYVSLTTTSFETEMVANNGHKKNLFDRTVKTQLQNLLELMRSNREGNSLEYVNLGFFIN